MFTIPGGLADRLGFPSFSINLCTADLATVENAESSVVMINPRTARRR